MAESLAEISARPAKKLIDVVPYCSSLRCSGNNCVAKGIIKNVGRDTRYCPDCGSSLVFLPRKSIKTHTATHSAKGKK